MVGVAAVDHTDGVCWQMASVDAVYKVYVDGSFLGRDALKVSTWTENNEFF